MNFTAVGLCLALTFLLGGLSYSAVPVASYAPGKCEKVAVVSSPDGRFKQRSIEGKECIVLDECTIPPSVNLYFRLDPEVRAKFGTDAYILIEFLDEGFGAVNTQFNSKSQDYADASMFMLLSTNRWKQVMIHLKNVKFRGSQNEGADFRLCFGGSVGSSPESIMPPVRAQISCTTIIRMS